MLTRIWGSYLGESLRQACGGEWAKQASDDGERIELQTDRATIHPHEQVRRRLMGGPD